MKRKTAGLVFGVVAALGLDVASAGQVLTFEGLKNFEPVGEYYNGGKGGMGTGPGPKYGITFSANGLAYIPGKQSGMVTPFPNDPSPPTVLLADNRGIGAGQPVTIEMNVSGGFSGALLFYYIAIGLKPEVTIYSGLNGGGMKLADKTFDLTGKELSNAVFSAQQQIKFSGIAQSVVFMGGNDQFGLDDISFAKLPEPSGWICLTSGLACSYVTLARRRRRPLAG
jgi:hypothetical protein